MVSRTVYLISSRTSTAMRAHFAVFIPSEADTTKGTLIQAVGAPMLGYVLEIKRDHSPASSTEPFTMTPIGEVSAELVVDTGDNQVSESATARNALEIAACQIQTPKSSQNFMAPVNDITNRRCQEWTMEYIRHLVAKGYIDKKAIEIVQSRRDPPTHGIGLQPVKASLGHRDQ